MKITTAVCAVFLLWAGFCAPAEGTPDPVIACNLKAINAAERPRYNDLMQRLRTAVRDRSSLDNGYVYHLVRTTVSLPEVAEWMSMERLCCPFLTLQLSASGNQENSLLTITGPSGVKSLLDLEFPVH